MMVFAYDVGMRQSGDKPKTCSYRVSEAKRTILKSPPRHGATGSGSA